jgi:orotate phosphoribosyltransferase
MLATIPLVGKALDIDLTAYSIRKEQKKYGLRNWIEGVPDEKPTMIIDDLCNSSASMRRSYDILSFEKRSVFNHAFCIVNKVNKKTHNEQRQTTDMYLPNTIKIIYLFDLDDFNLNNPSH